MLFEQNPEGIKVQSIGGLKLKGAINVKKKKKLNNKRIKIVDRIGFELIILHISRSTILCKVTYATADE